MRPATMAVQDLLAGWGPDTNIREFELYTFTLEGGEVLRYSGGQCGLQAPAPDTNSPLLVFPLGPGFKHNSIKEQIGVQVGELEIEVHAGPDDMLALGAAITWQRALWAGLFDGAWCALWRAYVQPPLNVVGTITRFYGPVGDVELGRTRPLIKVKSALDLLDVQFPKRLFQSACGYDFGAPGCDYDRVLGKNALGTSTGLGAVNITCLAGSSAGQILTSFTPATADDYDNGTIIATSGANNGYKRTLRQLISGVIYLFQPWIFPVVAGVDTFQLLPGCAHTQAACARRQNSLRFGGYPYIPPPEAAV